MSDENEFKVFHFLTGRVSKLLSDVYGLGMENTSSNLREKLDQLAKEMDTMVQQHIKMTVQSMAKNADSQCSHIFEGISKDIEEKLAHKRHIPRDFVKDPVVNQTGADILKKVSELNLSVVTLISDKVTDTLLAALSQCNTTQTEQLKKKKKEQADARDQLYRKSEATAAKEDDADREKVQVIPSESSRATKEGEQTKEGPKLDKTPSATDNILPAMRQERASSIARRNQRPISNPALDLENKKKSEDSSTPPRSPSPIVEASTESPTSSIIRLDEVKLEIKEEKNEIIKEKGSPTVTKKQKIEEQEKKEKEEKEEEKSEEMINDEIKEEPKVLDDTDGKKKPKDEFDLPELPTSAKKLEHVTKGRPRPTRRVARKPVARDTGLDDGVDDFFSASVRNTDFDKVPAVTEEKKETVKEVKKEETPKRPIGIGLPGMGSITPEMLGRRRNKPPVTEEKPKEEHKEPESPKEKDKMNGVVEEDGKPKSPDPAVKKRPPGAMGLPGMGFGGNVLAEMKLKKLNKSKSHDDSKPSDSEHTPFLFGPSMLKKTSHAATSPVAEISQSNNNNNNNNVKDWTKLRSTPNRRKSKSFEKYEKPQVTVKPTTKSPLTPSKSKPSPPPATTKPGRGVPPPLPSKPKPVALRPEFIDPKHVPLGVKLRAASWGKKASDSVDKK